LNDSIRRRYHNPCTYLNFFLKLPPYTLAGFNLTIHSASLLDGKRRRFLLSSPPGHNIHTYLRR
jgi:hypothetical protein